VSHLVGFISIVIGCWFVVSIGLSLVVGRIFRQELSSGQVHYADPQLLCDGYPVNRLKAFPSAQVSNATN